MRLEAYNRQQLLNMQRIAPLMDIILWRLCNKFRCISHINAERATEIPIKGCSENYLFAKLMEVFPNNIFIDMQVGPYFPDICLIISGMISIDIEIDEPYVMGSKKETHYRGCGDEQRDEYFINNGWYVIRFSEEQVIKNTDLCVNIINHLVLYLQEGDIKHIDKLFFTIANMATPKWTKEQSRLMSIKKYKNHIPR